MGAKKAIDLNKFKKNFLYLKLNIENKDTVNFFDFEIRFDELIGKLEFKLYIKPTNTFSYLLPVSNHPSHIFNNIPVSLFKRIRRICSNFIDFLYYGRILYIQLIKRNYNSNNLNGVFENISKLRREEIVPNNKINKMGLNDTIKYLLEFDYTYDNLLKNSV